MGSSTISLGLGLGGGKSATSSGTSGGGGGFENLYAVSFDGSDDYMEIPQGAFNLGSGNWTISFWFNADSLSGFPTPFVITGGNNSTGGLVQFSPYIRANNIGLITWGNNNFQYNSTISTGTWHHVVARKKGSGSNDISLWLNGVERATGYFSNTPDFGNDSQPTRVGYNTVGSTDYSFNGKIDEFAYFSTNLSDADIVAIYNSGVPADISSLNPVGWWRMGDGTEAGSGTTVYDMSSNSNNGTLNNMASPDGFVTDVPT
jgi:hypothetical protein